MGPPPNMPGRAKKGLMEKMMCIIILLLINLTSCVCGTFVVNVTQSSYQAAENHNITLEFIFTTKTDTSLHSLYIYCQLLTDLRPSVLFHLRGGVEVPESQDEQFKGRVQCDKDVLKEGRLRLHVSRLRTDDSGLCVCDVLTNDGGSTAKCRLSVTGQPQVIGSDEPIVAVLGDDVILPCHVEPKFNVQGLMVEWSKPDLKPDPSDRLSRVEYVHLYRDRQEVPDMKIQSYIGRTALFTDELREGNISLKIMNVTLADAGRYRCFIPKLKSRVKESIIYLAVETPLPPQTPDPNETDVKGGWSKQGVWILMGVACVLLILGGGVVGYMWKHRREEQNNPKYDMASTKPLLF